MKLDIQLVDRNLEIKKRIDESIMVKAKQQQARTYIGGSVLGKECERELWYDYKFPVQVEDPRIHRIFKLGHILELEVIDILKEAGYELFTDSGDGQFGGIDEEIGYNIDGVIVYNNEPHLLEIKSASKKRFDEMVKKGVKISDKVYYVQMITYMHYMGLDNGLFVAYCKDNSDMHFEIIKYNKLEAMFYINRGKEIARSETEPERKYKTKAFFACKFCKHSDRCFNENK